MFVLWEEWQWMLFQFICSGVGGVMEVLWGVMCVSIYVCMWLQSVRGWWMHIRISHILFHVWHSRTYSISHHYSTIDSICAVQHGASCPSVHGTQCPWVLSATIVFLVTFRALVRAAAFTTGVWKCVALNNRLETSSRSTVLSSTGTLPWVRPLWKEKTTKSGWPQGMTWLQPQTVIHALHTCKPEQLALKWCYSCMYML